MEIDICYFEKKFDEINKAIISIIQSNSTKEFYSPKEFAEKTGLNPDYVRELCRKKRLNHKRTNSGRGGKCEIRISHAELLRFQAEGLLSK